VSHGLTRAQKLTRENTKRGRKTLNRQLTLSRLMQLTIALIERRGIEAQSESGGALHGNFVKSRVSSSRCGSEHLQPTHSGCFPDEDSIQLTISDRRRWSDGDAAGKRAQKLAIRREVEMIDVPDAFEPPRVDAFRGVW